VKPLLFVTGHAPAYRVGAFARLHELEGIELALFGGHRRHGGPEYGGALPVPVRRVNPRELYALAAGGRYRGVVCPTGGRAALLATWAGARHARVPLILWASMWAHPRTPAHAFSYLPLRRLYSSADAVVTYGPHVSSYVRERGARNVFVAPQSVDNDFWSSSEVSPPSLAGWPEGELTRFLFVGRAAPEKGLGVLLDAWQRSALPPAAAALVLVGAGDTAARGGDEEPRPQGAGVFALPGASPQELRNVYAAADVLVVPSIPTREFREPWGVAVNEAMNRRLAVIASDAVGAAAGGLLRDGETGLVVPAGDAGALAGALVRLAGSHELRAQIGAAGALAVAAYSHDAWANGFSQALANLEITATRGHW
jgi:glycosyltransferase involved in cell wall biosynthesis